MDFIQRLNCFVWCIFGAISLSVSSTASAVTLWQDIATPQQKLSNLATIMPMPDKFRILSLDELTMRTLLSQSPPENTNLTQLLPRNFVELPLPDGTTISVTVEESSIMEPELAAKYPEIKTFVLRKDDLYGRLDITPLGFHALLLSDKGTVYIDPRTENNQRFYISYFNH